ISLIKFKLATFLSETGEFEKAIDMFREIATNSPNTPEAEMSIIKKAFIEMEELNKPIKAAETLKSFMEKYPNSDWLFYAFDIKRKADLMASQSIDIA
ncbi:MAG: tetratricopeptide repeat protein, partial [Armatimonadota bacterium]